jgi:hypothetical protein
MKFLIEGSLLDRDDWRPHSIFGDLTLQMAERMLENVKVCRDCFIAHMKEKYNEDHLPLKYRIIER